VIGFRFIFCHKDKDNVLRHNVFSGCSEALSVRLGHHGERKES
jgi:hypothetical protein